MDRESAFLKVSVDSRAMDPRAEKGGILSDGNVLSWPQRLLTMVAAGLLAASLLATAATPATAATYASIIMDADTGKVLYARNPDTRIYPASLTKMMTLYMLFEQIERGKTSLKTPMTVSKRAAGQPPSKLGLRAGESIRVEDAIKVLVIKSANDVATVVAEHVGGTESDFARLMTAKARKLGMTKTTFRNASGLPNSAQMSTARDMARLSIALKRDFPQYYKYFGQTETSFKGRAIRTHNRVLLNYDGADGLKTGYIRASGFNLATSAHRGGMSLVGVVIGGKTSRWRDRHMMSLLDKGFEQAQQLASLPRPARKPTSLIASIDPDATVVPVPPPTAAQGDADADSVAPAWGIQVGAFSAFSVARDQAVQAAETLRQRFGASRAAVTPVKDTGGGLVYRARVLGLDTEPQARAACQALRGAAKGCVVVPPDGADVALISKG